jgi:hypothetical protein
MTQTINHLNCQWLKHQGSRYLELVRQEKEAAKRGSWIADPGAIARANDAERAEMDQKLTNQLAEFLRRADPDDMSTE